MSNFDNAFDRVIGHEGGFTDDPQTGQTGHLVHVTQVSVTEPSMVYLL